ncbi:MAG: hypothetical protein K2X81_15755 [Candidatus Obscuribacterales bacterium]|nr:hypothetical protein [Candidatus Obscuribacterales bacterium]
MKKNELISLAFERETLPAALRGSVDTRLNGPAIMFGDPRPRIGNVAVGFQERPNYQEQIVPFLIVTNEASTFDVFSWTATYAPDSFPLSQFARVISDKDWEYLTLLPVEKPYKYMHEDKWASLILGELLAQGESDADLTGIPFSRANACFTSAIARAALLYPKDSSAFLTCINRLRKIELDNNFVRKPVSVSLLTKVWDMLRTHKFNQYNSHISTEGEVTEAVHVLLAHHGITTPSTDVFLSNLSGLKSDSIEERVFAFNRLLEQVGTKSEEEIVDSQINVIVASAAFFVGRGTSHIFLLRRLNKIFPSAVLWFGALAALAGPKCWDANWLRAIKGIEKHLRLQFNWEEPCLSDLCWHEYAWLTNVYSKGEYFEGLSKNFPNVVSVEIIPGASCQMRLASSLMKPVELEKIARTEKKSRREQDLEIVVGQLVMLATKAQNLIPSGTVNTLEKQPSLFEGDPALSSKAIRKKARGGTGFDK